MSHMKRATRPAWNRGFGFYAGACILLMALFIWIYEAHLEPLSAPPDPPPPGLHLSWAGQPIRGYMENANIQVSSCSRPAYVELELYPAVGKPWRPPPAGKIAFAVSGEWVHHMSPEPDVYVKRNLEAQSVPLNRQIMRTYTTTRGGVVRSAAYSFLFDPHEDADIDVVFKARWLSPRQGHDSCWLNLPTLLGGGGSVIAANKAIGHPNWAKDKRSAPLYGAGYQLNDQEGTVRVDPSSSLPLPSSLDPPSWDCGRADLSVVHNCQAFAVLQRPGADASRTSKLSQWNLGEGLLAGFIVGLLLEMGHLVFRVER
jgi:hypothetical protein